MADIDDASLRTCCSCSSRVRMADQITTPLKSSSSASVPVRIWRRSDCSLRESTISRRILPRQGVNGARLREAPGAQHAAVAVPAGTAVWRRIVAAVRQAIVESKGQASSDDLRLAELDERRVNLEPSALDPRAR